ncbi:hypothetical protein V8E55_005717 [Tylopilus felleus]
MAILPLQIPKLSLPSSLSLLAHKMKEVIPSSKNLGFYPSVWQGCLEDAKQECRVSHLLTSNPFPSKSRDLKTLIMEALTTTISEWNDNGVAFEPGYWPNHKTGMTCILLGDMSTWCSDLKTIAFTNSTAKLLMDSLFLQDGFDEQEVAIKFFYVGSYRITDKCPDQFCNMIPLACIALTGAAINCVLNGFAKNGLVTLKVISQFTAKEYWSTSLTMTKMLGEILHHSYHGRKLRKQVGKWGEEGWYVVCLT